MDNQKKMAELVSEKKQEHRTKELNGGLVLGFSYLSKAAQDS